MVRLAGGAASYSGFGGNPGHPTGLMRVCVVVVGVLLPAAAAVSDRQCIVWARECREPAEQH